MMFTSTLAAMALMSAALAAALPTATLLEAPHLARDVYSCAPTCVLPHEWSNN